MQPAELWLSDHETEGENKNQLRKWSQKLVLTYGQELGPLDLSKVLFFRVLNNRDLKKKGMTYRLAPPYNQLIKGVGQLLDYAFEGFGENTDNLKATVKHALDQADPAFVIVLFDDHHASDEDRMYTMLHELYHISPCMTKLRDHDTKDHYWMLESFGLSGKRDLTKLTDLL
jgi:hypothetical protein